MRMSYSNYKASMKRKNEEESNKRKKFNVCNTGKTKRTITNENAEMAENSRKKHTEILSKAYTPPVFTTTITLNTATTSNTVTASNTATTSNTTTSSNTATTSKVKKRVREKGGSTSTQSPPNKKRLKATKKQTSLFDLFKKS